MTPEFENGTLLLWRAGGTGSMSERNDPKSLGIIVSFDTDRSYPHHYQIWWQDLVEFVHYQERDILDFRDKGTILILTHIPA